LTYTWHEKAQDTHAVTGSLVVNTVALTNGQIAFADVTSFTFNVDNRVFWTTNLLSNSTFPIKIGNNGVPTSKTSSLSANYPSHGNIGTLTIDFNTGAITPNLEVWKQAGNGVVGIPTTQGSGYWSLSVPEPGTAAMACTAIVTALALALHRKLRTGRSETRRKGPLCSQGAKQGP
jgi:hypothetical protein